MGPEEARIIRVVDLMLQAAHNMLEMDPIYGVSDDNLDAAWAHLDAARSELLEALKKEEP